MSATSRTANDRSSKPWPSPEQFNEAIQNHSSTISDKELSEGKVALNSQGLPLLYAGGFADVYKVQCPSTGKTWAVKCFTQGRPGLRERYSEISKFLDQEKLGFTVDFEYQDEGILIQGIRYPIVKMHWVEGLTLSEFVAQSRSEPKVLARLIRLWLKLSSRMKRAGIAHADLQHANVMLIPNQDQGQLLLRLIDYDGMWIPQLSGNRSGEVGHRNFQHPQRAAKEIYSVDVDRFSHLAIVCALRCLMHGGSGLWERYNNEDNILFVESDFADPARSRIFRELWLLPDPDIRSLVGHLVLGTMSAIDDIPYLDELIDDSLQVRSLAGKQERRVQKILSGSPKSESEKTTIPTRSRKENRAKTIGSDGASSRKVFQDGNVPGGSRTASKPQNSAAKTSTTALPPWLEATGGPSSETTTNLGPTGDTGGLIQRADSWLADLAGGAGTAAHTALRIVCLGVPSSFAALSALGTSLFLLGSLSHPDSTDSHRPDLITSSARDTAEWTTPGLATEPQPSVDSATDPGNESEDSSQVLEPEYLVNSIGMQLSPIEPGEFVWDDSPIRQYTDSTASLTRPYFIGIHEVTKAQYLKVLGIASEQSEANNSMLDGSGAQDPATAHNVGGPMDPATPSMPAPGRYPQEMALPGGASVLDDGNLPMTNVSFQDADLFCRRLTAIERAAGNLDEGWEYRLPTNAEWEYAAKAGGPLDRGDAAGWFSSNSAGQPHEVGLLEANEWGLFDAQGNVEEWLLDEFPPDEAIGEFRCATTDPLVYGYGGERRMLRGGSWKRDSRDFAASTLREDDVGFRVVLAELPPDLLMHQLNDSLARREYNDSIELLQAIEDRRPDDDRIPIYRQKVDEIGSQRIRVETKNVALSESQAIDLIRIPNGRFMMGWDSGPSNAQPQHQVTISNNYYLSMREVTEQEFAAIIRNHQGHSTLPAIVSQADAMEFCRQLTQRERAEGKLSGNQEYRLPTEAEWEYAARAGTDTTWFFGDDSSLATRYTCVESSEHLHAVAQRLPNPWGLFDVLGNASEWTLDGFQENFASRVDKDNFDPFTPPDDGVHVVRGGSTGRPLIDCTCSVREAGDARAIHGFRIALALPAARLMERQSFAEKFQSALKSNDVTSASNILDQIERIDPSYPKLDSWKQQLQSLGNLAPADTPRWIVFDKNELTMKLVRIEAGEFSMGSQNGAWNEVPSHPVRLSGYFYIGMYEVTQSQYETVMKTNPSRFKGKELPVV